MWWAWAPSYAWRTTIYFIETSIQLTTRVLCFNTSTLFYTILCSLPKYFFHMKVFAKFVGRPWVKKLDWDGIRTLCTRAHIWVAESTLSRLRRCTIRSWSTTIGPVNSKRNFVANSLCFYVKWTTCAARIHLLVPASR